MPSEGSEGTGQLWLVRKRVPYGREMSQRRGGQILRPYKCGKEFRQSHMSDRDIVGTDMSLEKAESHAVVTAGVRGAYSGRCQTYDKQASSGCRWEAGHRPYK